MYNNEGGFFGDAGGYGETSTTPSAGGKGGSGKTAQNVLPVTTRQIRLSGESGVTIGNTTFHLVTVVGRVKSIKTSSVYIVYTIEDDRGCIEATRWLERDDGNDKSNIVENIYCRVYGSVKTQENKKLLMVFNISPIQSLNELTSHRLEVMLFAKKVELASNEKPSTNTTNDYEMTSNGGLGNSLMDTNHSKAPLSKLQKQIFEVIRKFKDPGVHVNEISRHLTDEIPQAQIINIVDGLMNEGHIYSSIDEFHFLSTETQ